MEKVDSIEATTRSYYDYFREAQVLEFLEDENVDTQRVELIDVDKRPLFLINSLFTSEELSNLPHRPSVGECKSEGGLIIVKPEALPLLDRAETYIADIGCKDIDVLPARHFTKEEWLSMYGYMLLSRPEIVNMYIIQRSLGMTAIRFNHLSADQYMHYGDPENPRIDQTDDINTIFDKKFCGSSIEPTPGTLRWEITNKYLSNTNFAVMSHDASIFDPVRYYRDGNIDDVFRAFNGFHVPSNNAEAYANLNLFSDDK